MYLYLKKNSVRTATTEPKETINCALIGDVEMRKPCVYFMRTFDPEDHFPMLCDEELFTVDIDGRQIELHLWNASGGHKDYTVLRKRLFPQMDVFLICFSVMDPKSFRNVELKWYSQVKHYCPDAKIILVGCKVMDIPDMGTMRKLISSNEKAVTYEEGLKMAKRIGAFQYSECSTFTLDERLTEVFKAAATSVLLPSLEIEKENDVENRGYRPQAEDPGTMRCSKSISHHN